MKPRAAWSLMAAVLVALVVANSQLAPAYFATLKVYIGLLRRREARQAVTGASHLKPWANPQGSGQRSAACSSAAMKLRVAFARASSRSKSSRLPSYRPQCLAVLGCAARAINLLQAIGAACSTATSEIAMPSDQAQNCDSTASKSHCYWERDRMAVISGSMINPITRPPIPIHTRLRCRASR